MAHNSSVFRAPFLQRISMRDDAQPTAQYPWTVPIINQGFELEFTHPVTIIMGPNGSGKSTLMEAIAGLCGFAQTGGNRDHAYTVAHSEHTLSTAFRAAWKPKINTGFFVRAETLSDFISGLVGAGYTDLLEKSHGEAFLELFQTRIRQRGIYLMDEPEAALSPTRQLELMRILRKAEDSGDAQFIIATHSPLLMAYPGATLLEVNGSELRERNFKTTEHFQLLQEFYTDPDVFIDKHLDS